jgi:hypothetical protein
MSFSLLLLAFALISLPARAEVLVYTGSATQQRPGTTHRTSRAFLVLERDGPSPRLTLLVGGSNAQPPFAAEYDRVTIYREKRFGFTHLRASIVDPLRFETRLDLTGNYTKEPAQLLQPRRFSGRLVETKFALGVVFILGDDPPGVPQAPDFSDLALAFSLDRQRTSNAREVNSSFEAVVAAIKARL